ncbi:EpsG family protein [Thalassococcus halodurans]|uniref:EpsG family protein n=1 Tax=Thalassococcus halodurans TaxID=373675 RepID=A0A1H5XEC9_9RHOB|nr:EpsG family protein [Thalassococcus halodurans]SEG10102.1 EpsG family protein [Thalassococcus halodurans]
MLYLGLAIFLFLLRFALARNGALRKQIYFLVLASLFVFSAFRFQVGCDWSGYYYQYLGAADFEWSSVTEIREPIWWAILSWIRDMGLPYPFINIFSSAIFFLGVHVLARRQPDPLGFLALLFPILIINLPMSGIRQGAAIGFLCIAFVAFIDRRPLWLALWVVLAAGFHVSALIFILLLPVATGRYTRNRLMLAAILAVPGAFFLALGDAAEIATSRYVNTGVDAAGAIFRVGILGLSALYFFLFVRKKWLRTWPQDYSLASIGAIGMTLAILLVPVSSVIGDRFGYYLIPIQAMIFARLPFLPFRANAALHAALPYLGLLLVFTVWAQLSGHFSQCYIPYQTWIFGFPGGDPFGF